VNKNHDTTARVSWGAGDELRRARRHEGSATPLFCIVGKA
jgi:hypothetical protein